LVPEIRTAEEEYMKLKVLVRSENVGGYSVSVPALPGCHSQGETLREALTNIREAAELWLEATAERATAQAVAESAEAQIQEIEL
jgi:predicted RNase H-like HicB family nuclease